MTIDKMIEKFNTVYCNDHVRENICKYNDCTECAMRWMHAQLKGLKKDRIRKEKESK